ncbi:MAG TPA: hypothetical protein VHR66_19400 [Gemmataceae bacterium]|nr:hypothetical protein [Gemmataceae bacterium]
MVLRGQKLYRHQLELSNRQMMFNSLTSLHHDLIAPGMQQAIRIVLSRSADDIKDPKTAEDLEYIELILRTFDLLGHRLQCGVLPTEETLQTEWITILTIWPHLQPFMKQVESRRKVPYKSYFKWLHQQAEAYKKIHHPNVEIQVATWAFDLKSNADTEQQADRAG